MTSKPLFPEERAQMLRVNLAGEYGARCIYQGQLRVLKHHACAPVLQEMLDQEAVHLRFFEQACVQERVRPSALSPLWYGAGQVLGMVTAALGPKTAMACTMAVETVIDQHYQEQIQALPLNDPLRETLVQFQAEEREHHDTASAHHGQDAPGYPLLSALIQTGSRLAIALAKRV
jgi:ubiquinone biosynthesis monooxygenase Coq7